MAIVIQDCPKCGRDAHTWRSQPFLFGKFPAGNLLLSFAILMAGASISKINLVFKHMGMSIYTIRTYFNHQKNFIFPIVLIYWEIYRTILIGKINKIRQAVWCGDGRFDSMGHCAKYGTYTMFSCSLMKAVHFEVVQVCIRE